MLRRSATSSALAAKLDLDEQNGKKLVVRLQKARML